jgi:hypothetical protein
MLVRDKISKKQTWRLKWLLVIIAIAIYSYFLLYYLVYQSFSVLPTYISSQDDAEFLIGANNDFLIFYGTIFLTCVVGLIAFPELDWGASRSWIKGSFLVLYFILLAGIPLSIEGIINSFRKNFTIMYSSNTFDGNITSWMNQTTRYDFNKNLQGDWGPIFALIASLLFIVLFTLLFFKKIESKQNYALLSD